MSLHCKNQKAQLCQNGWGCNTAEHFTLRQSLERQHLALLRKQRKSKRLTILCRPISFSLPLLLSPTLILIPRRKERSINKVQLLDLTVLSLVWDFLSAHGPVVVFIKHSPSTSSDLPVFHTIFLQLLRCIVMKWSWWQPSLSYSQ